ncbi:hypothetical protein BSK50_19005 [Paenibacillus odorifer]|nr:hypothetical protein BSK50_19005 [Paenibacillus odorifer]
MNIETERCLYEEGQFLSFVREHIGITLYELSNEMEVSIEDIECFEDGDTYYLDDFNKIHKLYIDKLDKLASCKGLSLQEVLSKFVDYTS